jgi:hypothetical protein
VLAVLVVAEAAALGWLWWGASSGWSIAAGSTARVEITSDPDGLAVVVDGVPRGLTPFAEEMEAGPHQVWIGVEGGASTRTLYVRPGVGSTIHVVQRAVAAAPALARAALEITTDPPGLSVSIDGQPRGVSPIVVSDLLPGAHDVTVARGTMVWRRTVPVEVGVQKSVLISTAGAGIASGWLTVTGPVPLQIEENGTLVGSSDTPRLLLPVGRHDLVFVSNDFAYRTQRTIQITAGDTARVALEPASGTLSVNAQPWGEVWIDGKLIGETPIGNLSIPIGNHELVVRHPQFGERRQTIAVSVDTPLRVGVNMRP